ncbi:hypothetical protein [Klebsiella pneumoniae]|uniref:hypothetical protein n=1 Tax=Klebsiella pneumoniae TaxID=573 RepID=UPI002FE5830E
MGDINHLIAFLLQPGIDGALNHHPHCRQQDNNHQNEEAADVAGDQGEFFRGHLVAERLIIVCKQDVAPE